MKHRQRKPEGGLQSTVTGYRPDLAACQTEPDEGGAQTSSAVYENDNKAYVNITDNVTVSEYEGLETTYEYSNTAHIYSNLKLTAFLLFQ